MVPETKTKENKAKPKHPSACGGLHTVYYINAGEAIFLVY